MNLLINLLLVFFVLVALLMVLVILMQRPKSEGLGAAFGGAVTENIFGAQTTNVLVKFTTWLAGVFFALTFGLSVLYAHRGTGGESAFRRELMKQQTTPATSPAPSAKPSPVPSQAGLPVQQTSPNTSARPGSSAVVSPSQSAISPAQSTEGSPKPNP
ncbi:MAG TPA: preprotein translocase subunit SecG [Candidatus Udaeobacter sp.]|jgi:preprotein translocase subunit SecG|nr:preprotein translocase subunit SecG [Candidatus Udaeobacter sp.]